MRIYLKNIRAKFHPDLFWNNVALDILRSGWRVVVPTRPRQLAIWDQFLI